jgi:hypothetical protein
VRKLGMPSDPRLAIGALATGGAIHLRHAAIRAMGVTRDQLADVIAREAAELQRRDALYRGARPPLPVEGRVVIVVDDGVATGASMRVALQALRAVPRASWLPCPSPAGAAHMFDDVADAFVTVLQPRGSSASASSMRISTRSATTRCARCSTRHASGTTGSAPPDAAPARPRAFGFGLREHPLQRRVDVGVPMVASEEAVVIALVDIDAMTLAGRQPAAHVERRMGLPGAGDRVAAAFDGQQHDAAQRGRLDARPPTSHVPLARHIRWNTMSTVSRKYSAGMSSSAVYSRRARRASASAAMSTRDAARA